MIAVKVNIVTPKYLQIQGLMPWYANLTAYVTQGASPTGALAAVQSAATAACYVQLAELLSPCTSCNVFPGIFKYRVATQQATDWVTQQH